MPRRKQEYCDQCNAPMTRGQSIHGASVCTACYIHERNIQDQMTLGEVVEMCRERNVCVYCGEWAQDVEHVVPRDTGLPTWTVRACSECNGIAGATLFDGFVDKRNHIHDRLRKRHARLLALPEWDAEEIEEMGRGMQEYVRKSEFARRIVAGRVDFKVELLLGER